MEDRNQQSLCKNDGYCSSLVLPPTEEVIDLKPTEEETEHGRR